MKINQMPFWQQVKEAKKKLDASPIKKDAHEAVKANYLRAHVEITDEDVIQEVLRL